MGNVTEVKKKGVMQKAGAFLDRHAGLIATAAIMAAMCGTMVFANNVEDTLWDNVVNLIQTWVTRLGGVVMFVGGIMFGLGWKSDDAEQKSRGVSTIIAGAIVVAVAALTSTFFNA